jgi:uncharacterized protein YecE (DUF72 family)
VIRVGSCSWTAPGWERAFYLPRTPPRDFITRYAERYDAVEIDATFYAVPDPKVVLGWKQRTPDDFVFSAKIPRMVTHEKVLLDCDIELHAFMESISCLEHKLGVLVFQFPYFARDVLQLDEFLTRLGKVKKALPPGEYAVEVRNRNWISDTLFNGLSNLGYAFTPVALPGMPAVAAYSKKNAVTTDFVYMRFLGDRIHCEEMLARSLGEVAFTETVTDRSDELGTWATWIEELTKKNVSVYVYINNHYSGFAPRDIDDLKWKLGLQVLAPKAPQQSALEF